MKKIIELFDNAIIALEEIEDKDFDQDRGNLCVLAHYYRKYKKDLETELIAYIDEHVDNKFVGKYYDLIEYIVSYNDRIILIAKKYDYPLFKKEFDIKEAINRIEFAKTIVGFGFVGLWGR